MEEENVQAQYEVVEQEEQTLDEEETFEEESEEESNIVSISKDELKSIKRKAMAYDATKKSKVENKNINNNPQLSEELKLIARGLSDEEIDQAKVIARGRNIPLTEAIKDPLFLTYQNDLVEKKQREEAKLGASKGSGESQEESGIRGDMTREEHMAAFNKVMGK